jgi:iron complex transport system substrate-binding protein
MRLISICPSNTDLVDYLGFASELVGIDNYSDLPASCPELPRLGSDMDIDMDAVERLQPDLVIASLSVPGMERNVEALQARGIPHIVIHNHTLEEIGDGLLQVAAAVGRTAAGEAARAAFRDEIERLRALSMRIAAPKALYWEWWPKPVFTPGGGNWLTEISRLAGARNVFENRTEPSVKTDWDDVLGRSPEYICMVWVGSGSTRMKPELLPQRPGWLDMPAIRDNRILLLEESLYCRPSPKLLVGAERLGSRLHPEVYGEPAPQAK